MKEFPNRLNPENKEKFVTYRYDRNIAYMRKEIFELVLRGDENCYFELDKFSRDNSLLKEEMQKMCKTVIQELHNLGWNCKTSFGGTGLFIYSTNDPPASCYSDEL